MGEEMGCSRRKWPQSLQMGSKTGKCTCEQFLKWTKKFPYSFYGVQREEREDNEKVSPLKQALKTSMNEKYGAKVKTINVIQSPSI